MLSATEQTLTGLVRVWVHHLSLRSFWGSLLDPVSCKQTQTYFLCFWGMCMSAAVSAWTADMLSSVFPVFCCIFSLSVCRIAKNCLRIPSDIFLSKKCLEKSLHKKFERDLYVYLCACMYIHAPVHMRAHTCAHLHVSAWHCYGLGQREVEKCHFFLIAVITASFMAEIPLALITDNMNMFYAHPSRCPLSYRHTYRHTLRPRNRDAHYSCLF